MPTQLLVVAIEPRSKSIEINLVTLVYQDHFVTRDTLIVSDTLIEQSSTIHSIRVYFSSYIL